MATYPTSVKTFATKSDGAGNTIQAEHINALQDEVTAIEDGLLNGTAPVTSSRVSAAALTVSGGSTLTTLTVTGGSTLASLTVLGATDAARVTNSVLIQIPNGAATGLNFDTQRWATTGMHSTTTNSSRVVAVSSGFYDISASVEISSGGLGQRDLRLVLNDATVIGRASLFSSSPSVLTATTTYRLGSTSDYVTVQIYFDGSTGRVLAGANYTPELTVTKRR